MQGAWCVILCAALLPVAGELHAQPDDDSLWRRDALTGGWGGARRELATRGYHVEANYVGDVFANVSGGIKRDTEYLDNIELKLVMDLRAVVGWPDARFLIYGLRNNGGSVSANVGDAQGIDNIETVSTFKLFEVWLQQNLLRNRVSLLAGLYDVNSEFDVIQSAGLFINSSHGMGAEFAGSGLSGPSTFPFTAPALRLKVLPNRSVYGQLLVADGVPGDPTDTDGNEISLSREQGALLVGEIGWYRLDDRAATGAALVPTRAQRKHIGREVTANYTLKLAAGVWTYTSNFEVVRPNSGPLSPTLERDRGAYVLADWRVYHETKDRDQGVSIFGRYGRASDLASRFDAYVGAGLTYRGPIPHRDTDQVGLAIGIAHNSRYFQSITSTALEARESIVELTYRLAIAPWLGAQPDFQYVINPGTDPAIGNAVVLGLRIEVNL